VRSEFVDHRADLYSCGVVFYNLLAGTVPFKAVNRVELMRMIVNDPPTPASTYLPDLPDWCGKLIDKALAKAPIDRFQTAEEFRSALTTAIGSATGMAAQKLSSPAVFEGAPTVVIRAPVAPAAVAAPVTAAVPPPPIAPIPAATPAQRAPVAKASNRHYLVAAAGVLAVLIAAVAAYNFNSRVPANGARCAADRAAGRDDSRRSCEYGRDAGVTAGLTARITASLTTRLAALNRRDASATRSGLGHRATSGEGPDGGCTA
jgi:serine/threonine-protein kinase